MKLLSMNVDNSPYLKADKVVVDSMEQRVVFSSFVGYKTSVKSFLTKINKKNSLYVAKHGHFGTSYKMYDTKTYNDTRSEYVHGLIRSKDIPYIRGDEQIGLRTYLFTDFDIRLSRRKEDIDKLPQEFIDLVYNRLYEKTPAPMLKEWARYLISHLVMNGYLSQLSVSKQDDESFCAFSLTLYYSNIINFISEGLKKGEISIQGSNKVSPEMEQITGLDSYLGAYTGILADQIENSFRPKFIPGQDKYSENLSIFKDYASYNGLDMYEAQKNVVQAAANNFKKSDVTFVIGEMGSGKTLLGLSTIFATTKKEGTTNVVMAPSHLVYKWQSEIKSYMPLSEVVVVDDFNHFKALEPKINDPRRRKHLFLILSKETAKFGYDLRPSPVWSQSRRAFTCPTCGQTLFKEEYRGTGRSRRKVRVPLSESDFVKEYAYNKACSNIVRKKSKETGRLEEQLCNTKLWTPVVKENPSDWVKLPKSEGWYKESHLERVKLNARAEEKPTSKTRKLISAIEETQERLSEDVPLITRAPRKYPISKYIKKYYKNKIDFAIIDEMHLYKGGDSIQGQAFGDIVNASKKTLGLTGTLLNGYANGLFYILYRTFPHTMRKEGFYYSDEALFAREFGVTQQTTRFALSPNGTTDRRLGGNEKILPGVSPLVFTKFLLNNAVFLSLSDISEGLPGYEEIPVPVQMDDDLFRSYQKIEDRLRSRSDAFVKGGRKAIGPIVQAMSVYPDQPYNQPDVLHPDTGETIIKMDDLGEGKRNKERAFIDLVKERIKNDEKVLVYYHWTNKTDLKTKLPSYMEKEGIKSAVLDSTTVKSKDREDWIKKQVEDGVQVLFCNPTLVETGLDLLDFTSIIFYQVGYNLFTMRQASRRSLRLSQTKDIKVYFMYYESSIQEQALSLMATKLQASQAIEGKFSEEGLHAMSNNEDLLTQIANSLIEGIKHTVEAKKFAKTKGNDLLDILMDSDGTPAKATTYKPKKREKVYSGDFRSFSYATNVTKRAAKKKKQAVIPENHSEILESPVKIANLF